MPLALKLFIYKKTDEWNELNNRVYYFCCVLKSKFVHFLNEYEYMCVEAPSEYVLLSTVSMERMEISYINILIRNIK
jgi:hypothetical protein